jgi:ABC-2 type transport system ATP-binding protein
VLSEVSSVADRVGIIRAGRIVAVDDVAALRARALHTLEARLGAPPPPGAFDSVPGVRAVQIDGATVRMELGGDMDGIVKALAGYQVHDLIVAEPSLEEVFLGYYRSESL